MSLFPPPCLLSLFFCLFSSFFFSAFFCCVYFLLLFLSPFRCLFVAFFLPFSRVVFCSAFFFFCSLLSPWSPCCPTKKKRSRHRLCKIGPARVFFPLSFVSFLFQDFLLFFASILLFFVSSLLLTRASFFSLPLFVWTKERKRSGGG